MIYTFEWNTQITYIQTIGANESTRKMVKRKNRRASMLTKEEQPQLEVRPKRKDGKIEGAVG